MQTHSSSCFSDRAGQAKPSEQCAERSGNLHKHPQRAAKSCKITTSPHPPRLATLVKMHNTKKEAVKKIVLELSSYWAEHMAKFMSDFLTYF